MITMAVLQDIFTERELAVLKSTGQDEVCVVRKCDAYPGGALVKVKRAARDAAFAEAVKKAADLVLKELKPISPDDIAGYKNDFKPWDNWVTVTMWLKDGSFASRTVTIEDVILQ